MTSAFKGPVPISVDIVRSHFPGGFSTPTLLYDEFFPSHPGRLQHRPTCARDRTRRTWDGHSLQRFEERTEQQDTAGAPTEYQLLHLGSQRVQTVNGHVQWSLHQCWIDRTGAVPPLVVFPKVWVLFFYLVRILPAIVFTASCNGNNLVVPLQVLHPFLFKLTTNRLSVFNQKHLFPK